MIIRRLTASSLGVAAATARSVTASMPGRRTVWVLLAAVLFSGPMTAVQAIPNGRQDDAGLYKNVVMLVGKAKICSAVLVLPTVAITAAHCVGVGVQGTYVRQGGGHSSPTAQVVKVVTDETPPGNAGSITRDYAALYLDRPLPFRKIMVFPQNAAIEPYLKQQFRAKDTGLLAIIAGFGNTTLCARPDRCPTGSAVTFKDVKLVRDSNCSVTLNPLDLGRRAFIGEYLCVAGDTVPANWGDSGGPLFLMANDGTPVLVGIVSEGKNIPDADGFLTEMASVHRAIGHLQAKVPELGTIPTYDFARPQ